jgi:hypothetical protein
LPHCIEEKSGSSPRDLQVFEGLGQRLTGGREPLKQFHMDIELEYKRRIICP